VPRVGREVPLLVESVFLPSHRRGHVLIWVEKFTPQPQELIDLWNDYTFMLPFNTSTTSADKRSRNDSHTLSHMSLNIETLRILYAYKVTAMIPYSRHVLFRIGFLLGLSWDELRAAFCPLCEILGRDTAHLTKRRKRRKRRTCILDETLLATLDTGSVLVELAKASLRQIDATRQPHGWAF
jgi:hypothetical protein